jgi:hypothetical protein
MFLRINDSLRIDNLNDYPVEVVSQLEALLASGVEARPDQNRKNFYDVEESGRGFFIHALPRSGNVMLLATWVTESPLVELSAAM